MYPRVSGYAHMGPPATAVLGDIWDDIGKGIDAAKSVKDIVAGHAPVVYPVNTDSVPRQAEPSIFGMSIPTVLWLGAGTLAVLLFMRRGRRT